MRGLALIVPLLLAAGAAGCLREFDEPSFVQIANLDLAPAQVLARDVVLNVTTTLDNSQRGDADAVRLKAKAYSETTGFLVAENTTASFAVPGDTTMPVSQFLKVPRDGSVRIEVLMFEEARGERRATISARNLASLEPEVLDTGLRVSDLDFVVRNVSAERVRVQTDIYVTNEGRDASESLRMQVKAREVSTSLVSDVQWLTTGSVVPQATAVRSVNLTVADGYNYVFEILLWRGDVIIARHEGTVQLAPTFQKPEDQEVITTNPDIKDFVRPTSPADSSGAPGFGAPETADGVPGAAAGAALVAVGAAALAIGRRRR